MRAATVTLLALAALACNDEAAPASAEQQTEVVTQPPTDREVERERVMPAAEGPPPIPGLLLANLKVDGEGSFALLERTDELEPNAAVALRRGLAFVGGARDRGGSDAPGQRRRWIGLVPNGGRAHEIRLDAGSIHAAIGDGDGGALLGGSDGDGRAWFGALNTRGTATASIVLDGSEPFEVVEVLAGHGPDERALLLGASGRLVSFDAHGQVRVQGGLADLGDIRVHAGARVPGERGELLLVGGEAWWARLDAGAPVERGTLEIQGADPIRTLDAIVPLDRDMGFIALGRARREAVQDHEQAIAVGFDRDGRPTWTRVLDHFRAVEIYGGSVHRDMRGVVHFVARIPSGGEDRTALAWIQICPGVDGYLVARQLAGTIGWASVGFVAGRDDGAIATYTHTEAGIDWRILLVEAGPVWG